MRELTEVIKEVEQIAQTINDFKDRCKKLANTPATADELYQLSSAAGELSISAPDSFGYIAQGFQEAGEMAFWEELADDEKPEEPEPSVKLTRGGLKSERSG